MVQKIFKRGGFFPDEPENDSGTLPGHKLNRVKRNLPEMMRVERAVHDDHGRMIAGRRLHAERKFPGVVTVVNRQDFFARETAFRKQIGERVGNGQHAVHAKARRHGNLIALERLDQRTGREPGRPRFHEAGEQIGEIHHDRHGELSFQASGGHGGNGVLRNEQIEFRFARGPGDHAFEEKRIGQIFEVAEPGVTAHLPFGEWMQPDAELFFDVCRVGDSRAEDMDFVAAADHFLDEINRLRRAAAGRRIKRFVRQERDAELGCHARR